MHMKLLTHQKKQKKDMTIYAARKRNQDAWGSHTVDSNGDEELKRY